MSVSRVSYDGELVVVEADGGADVSARDASCSLAAVPCRLHPVWGGARARRGRRGTCRNAGPAGAVRDRRAGVVAVFGRFRQPRTFRGSQRAARGANEVPWVGALVGEGAGERGREGRCRGRAANRGSRPVSRFRKGRTSLAAELRVHRVLELPCAPFLSDGCGDMQVHHSAARPTLARSSPPGGEWQACPPLPGSPAPAGECRGKPDRPPWRPGLS